MSATIDHAAKPRVETVMPGLKPEPIKAEILVKSGNATIAGFLDLTKAYQALATKNAERLSTSIQALSSAKTPTEFFALQQKLITESVEAAVNDSAHIAKLTTSIFTAAFEPVQKQFESMKTAAQL